MLTKFVSRSQYYSSAAYFCLAPILIVKPFLFKQIFTKNQFLGLFYLGIGFSFIRQSIAMTMLGGGLGQLTKSKLGKSRSRRKKKISDLKIYFWWPEENNCTVSPR